MGSGHPVNVFLLENIDLGAMSVLHEYAVSSLVLGQIPSLHDHQAVRAEI